VPTEIGRRLMNALAYAGLMEAAFLLEEQETFDAELLTGEARLTPNSEQARQGCGAGKTGRWL